MSNTKRKGRSVSDDAVRVRCEELGLIFIRTYIAKQKTHVVFRCSRHLDKGDINAAWTHLRTAKRGCPYCTGKYRTTKDFVSEVNLVHPELTVLGEYISVRTPIRVRCSVCEHEWSPEARSLLTPEGCPVCSKRQRSLKRRCSHEDFVNKLFAVAPHLDVIGVYEGTHRLISVRCRIHGNEWSSFPCNLLNQTAGCPICAAERNSSSSYGERKIADWLTEHGIAYFPEHKFSDCVYKHPLRFDFYLPQYNMAIEFDGEQHYAPVFWYADKPQKFADAQSRDAVKDEYCTAHQIELVRISYTQVAYIADILTQIFSRKD